MLLAVSRLPGSGCACAHPVNVIPSVVAAAGLATARPKGKKPGQPGRVHDADGRNDDHKNPGSGPADVVVALLNFHHIYSGKKKKAIVGMAATHNLAGLYLFGRPGRVLVEGDAAAVSQYCTKIKSLRWQYVTVVDSHVVAKPSFQGFDEVESDRELGKLMTGANLEPLFRLLFRR